jgi:pyrrolidone-carboxylate peptidase
VKEGKILPTSLGKDRVLWEDKRMKLLFIITLFSTTLFAKPVILVSYYDAFDRAPFNSSDIVAHALEKKLNTEDLAFEIKLCALNTVFDRAYSQLETCLKANPETEMVLGLGESNCNFKVETMMRNKDQTFGPDNAGNERKKTIIIPEAPEVLGLSYPIKDMYCALPPNQRKEVEVSNNAGSFVCNNTAFQMSFYYPEMDYGFIHVPANNCRDLAPKTQVAIENLSTMLKSLKHFEGKRIPTTKKSLELLRAGSDQCGSEFYKRVKSF